VRDKLAYLLLAPPTNFLSFNRVSSNKYQPSEAASDIAASDDMRVRVDGDSLVLPSGCTLPPYCIKTNQPVSERDMILTNLIWRSAAKDEFRYLVGFRLMEYLVGSDQCQITYGLTPKLYRRRVYRFLIKILMTIALFAATLFFAVSESRNRLIGPAMFVTFGLFTGSFVSIFLGNSLLQVVRKENEMFWVKGFSQEYLDSLET
jgi:hypothetical protein